MPEGFSAERRVYSVSQVNHYTKSLLDADLVLSGLWVSGEISNYKIASNGHAYFKLKDAGAEISAVCFQGNLRSLNFLPVDGLAVEAYGAVSLYERGGSYQITIRTMQPQGHGELMKAYEALKAKLYAEGLFDEAHKKPIPKFPHKVGIVTAKGAAALQDIINVSRHRNPGIQLVLCPAQVQGDTAAQSVVSAIKMLDARGDIDVMIVGRGGGSIEDLWAFNEEIVARAVYDCKTPVISAVGHEVDFTIIDFVSDKRAATPSQAAEFAAADSGAYLNTLQNLKLRLKNAMSVSLNNKRIRLDLAKRRLQGLSPQAGLEKLRDRLVKTRDALSAGMQKTLIDRRHRVELMAERIRLLDPFQPLQKGYAFVYDAAGRGIKTVTELTKGQSLSVMFADGEAGVSVTEIKKHEE